MEVTARLRNARISAQKVRLVADQVRGLPVEKAEQLLTFSNKKAAHIVRKVLLSAVARKTFVHYLKMLSTHLGASIPEPEAYLEKPPEAEEIIKLTERLIG